MVLGTTIAAEIAGKVVLSNGLATQIRPRKYYMVPRETLDAMIGDVHELINFFVIEAQRILFAENVSASILVCILPLFVHPQRPLNLYTDLERITGLHLRLPLLLPRKDRPLLGPRHLIHDHGVLHPSHLHIQRRAY